MHDSVESLRLFSGCGVQWVGGYEGGGGVRCLLLLPSLFRRLRLDMTKLDRNTRQGAKPATVPGIWFVVPPRAISRGNPYQL